MSISSERLAIGVAFIALAVLACFAPAQGDTWWLLRAGRDIWATGHVPLVDTYSYTAAGAPWPNHEWLTEALFYGLFRIGGLPLLTAACAAAAVGAWALAASVARGPFEARFGLLVACMVPTAITFALRPQMLTLLFFSVVCVLLVRNRLFWVPFVMLVWANCHGAVALGLVAIAGAAVAALVADRRRILSLVWTGAASAAATLLTPLGIGLWRFWIESPARSRVNDLIEWRSPDLSPAMWPFWLLAALLVIATLRNRRHLAADTRCVVAIALCVLPLALQAMRNVPIFVLVAYPAVTSVVGSVGRRSSTRSVHERGGLNAVLLALSGAVAILVVALSWTFPPSVLGWRPFAPEALAAVSRCEGPLFNTYAAGGALIWFLPTRPVFVDSRQDPYPMELVAASFNAELTGDYRAAFDAYGVRCTILPVESPLAERLRTESRWSTSFRDNQWVVFESVQ